MDDFFPGMCIGFITSGVLIIATFATCYPESAKLDNCNDVCKPYQVERCESHITCYTEDGGIRIGK